ncbi:MAG: hypothetical protein LRY62_00155, partial [Alphaproteobacteria bacterium]|nr:hypothetical protein [Alphaproteobacteria bacterium]
QPMQTIVEKCRENPAIEVVLIKAIDRFTRGGSSAYIKLKEQLDEAGMAGGAYGGGGGCHLCENAFNFPLYTLVFRGLKVHAVIEHNEHSP